MEYDYDQFDVVPAIATGLRAWQMGLEAPWERREREEKKMSPTFPCLLGGKSQYPDESRHHWRKSEKNWKSHRKTQYR